MTDKLSRRDFFKLISALSIGSTLVLANTKLEPKTEKDFLETIKINGAKSTYFLSTI